VSDNNLPEEEVREWVAYGEGERAAGHLEPGLAIKNPPKKTQKKPKNPTHKTH
jgi:hypothetical protein